jgi:hypothetical protein
MELTHLNSRAQRSLVAGTATALPGALSVLALAGGITVAPQPGLLVRFGRNRPQVEVCVGEDDLRISRVHGQVAHRNDRWWLSNTGRSPIRLSNSIILHRESEPLPLSTGYTAVFLRGSRDREHLLELHVTGTDGDTQLSRPGHETVPPKRWRLTTEERQVLTVVGQRFLLHDPQPQPLSRQQAAAELAALQPRANWTIKRVEHIVSAVRRRLSQAGVYGLQRDEVGEPIGLALTINLMRELVLSTSLVPLDLDWLDNLD